jgi:hypothetical protein
MFKKPITCKKALTAVALSKWYWPRADPLCHLSSGDMYVGKKEIELNGCHIFEQFTACLLFSVRSEVVVRARWVFL